MPLITPTATLPPMPTSSANYTLQIMSGMNINAMERYIQKHYLADHARIMKTQYKGHDWYVLAYGRYTNASDAKAALNTLSGDIKSRHPWVRSTQQLLPIGRP